MRRARVLLFFNPMLGIRNKERSLPILCSRILAIVLRKIKKVKDLHFLVVRKKRLRFCLIMLVVFLEVEKYLLYLELQEQEKHLYSISLHVELKWIKEKSLLIELLIHIKFLEILLTMSCRTMFLWKLWRLRKLSSLLPISEWMLLRMKNKKK